MLWKELLIGREMEAQRLMESVVYRCYAVQKLELKSFGSGGDVSAQSAAVIVSDVVGLSHLALEGFSDERGGLDMTVLLAPPLSR